MKKPLATALSIVAIIIVATPNAVNAQQVAQPVVAQSALPLDAAKNIPDDVKTYIGTFGFKTNVTEGKFWISYDGTGLRVDRFRYKDDKGERDLPGVSIVKAEAGTGYTIVGRSWKIKNLVPDKDGKLLVGTFERGTIQNRILYWREKE